jgi:hypothetical protein
MDLVSPGQRAAAVERGHGRQNQVADGRVPPEGSGSHRIAIGGDAGSFTGPGRVRTGGCRGTAPRDGGLSRPVW